MIPASSSSWRITQSTTPSVSRPSIAAACKNGASTACERLAQCDPCVVPAPTPAVIARAINIAPSHWVAQRIGDHRSCCRMLRSPVPVGSNTHKRPDRVRAGHVEAATSVLVEVHTAGPRWTISAGTITALVFPDRGGPSNSTARCERANRRSPFSFRPRYVPPPSRRAYSFTAASGSWPRIRIFPVAVVVLQPARFAASHSSDTTNSGPRKMTNRPVVVPDSNSQAAKSVYPIA